MPQRKWRTLPLLTTTALTLALFSAPATHATGAETAQQKADQQKTAQQLAQDATPKDTDRLIVTFKDNATEADKAQAVKAADQATGVLEDTKTVKKTVANQQDTTVVATDKKLDENQQKTAIKALEKQPQVKDARPDYIVKATAGSATATNAANSPYNTNQYHLATLGMPTAWNYANGEGQTIGYADTGAPWHPDLNPNVVGGYDFISDEYYARDGSYGRDADPTDNGTYTSGVNSNWHGTHVMGLGSAPANGIGVTGTAPGAKAVNARVMGTGGSGYISDFADGVYWLAGGNVAGVPTNKTPATVINLSMSWYSPTCDPTIGGAIQYAYNKNIPVVVAAGNSGDDAALYSPSNCLGAIVVGATTSWGTMTTYSNTGWPLDVVAPGGTVGSPLWSTYNTGTTTPGYATYGGLSGTSMASPTIAGVVADIKEAYPGVSIEKIRNYLTSTGTNIDGYQQVNAGRAVAAAYKDAPTVSRYALKTGSAIAATYNNSGGQDRYGTPTSNEFGLRDNGVGQNFSKNYTIYWRANTGANPVKFSGAIGAKYRADGYENAYGYPMNEEQTTDIDGGYYQRFLTASGTRTSIYWQSAFGAHAVKATGAIGGKFNESGALTGYGYPRTDEIAFWDGYKQHFGTVSGARTAVYWSPSTGAHSMNENGAIYNKWATGGDYRKWGMPVTDETGVGDRGAVTYFRTQNGGETGIFWSNRSAASAVNSKGALYWNWVRNGYTSTYGYPTHDERVESDGKTHLRFTSGAHLTWSASEGVKRVS